MLKVHANSNISGNIAPINVISIFTTKDPTFIFYLLLLQLELKLQHNSLALVASLKRATDEGSLPEIAHYSPYYLNILLLPKDPTFIYLLSIQCIYNLYFDRHQMATSSWSHSRQSTNMHMISS